MKNIKVEDRLLATHISNNSNFEAACLSGNATQIMSIVQSEMTEHNLFTKGAKKLRDDIFKMTRGHAKISLHIGQSILMFVWNSRLSGVGLAVC
jgi:hypothetical protein